MDRSKLVVLFIGFLIVVGVIAWSWVNLTQSPVHDPEVAHAYLQHFDRLCALEFEDDQICAQVIGDHHRVCFEDHLEPTPEEDVEEQGPVIYSRSAYLACMRQQVGEALSARGR